MKRVFIPALKMTLAAVAAILVSDGMGLVNATTAGVIALLSVQSTKRDSFLLAFKRGALAIIGILLCSFLFSLLGFSILIFGLFLILLIPLAYIIKLQEGIVVTTVLATHFLIQGNLDILFNEMLILLIGLACSLLVNLYMPNSEKELIKQETVINELIAGILRDIGIGINKNYLDSGVKGKLDLLEEGLGTALKRARDYTRNLLFNNSFYHINYLNMRYSQMQNIKQIYDYLMRINEVFPVSRTIANYFQELSQDIGFLDKATIGLEKLNDMRLEMKSLDLPKSRNEFENRAMLYQILNALEEFLQVKINFHLIHDDKI